MKNFFLLILLIIGIGCSSNSKKEKSKYLRHVGDISFDANKDKTDFKLCGKEKDVYQYFNFGEGLTYEGEKITLEKEIRTKYKSVDIDESGLIRIRFIVNCKGELGRFRLMGMNLNYQKKDFNSKITKQLLNITKNLKGWKKQVKNNIGYDYYQYLIFKIEKGNLIEVLP